MLYGIAASLGSGFSSEHRGIRVGAVVAGLRSDLPGRPLRQVQTPDIQAVFTAMIEKGLSRRTVQLTRTITKAALRQTFEEGLIARNPADATKLPLMEKKAQEPYFTQDEALHLLDVAKDDRPFASYHLLLLTGLRKGEMLGLKWEDLDLKAKTLAVRRSLVEVKNPDTHKVTLDFHPPKTEKSAATIPLEDDLIKSLKSHKAKQNEERLFFGQAYNDSGLVFCTEDGKPIGRGTSILVTSGY